MERSGPLDDVGIDGVRFRGVVMHRDARGSFAEHFVADRDFGIEPLQWSVVHSAPGVLRGMHVHVRHDEFFSVISGHATVGLYDLRPNSPTAGQSALFEIYGNDPLQLVFPRGLLHGWLFHEPTAHLQATSEAHVTYNADDNWGAHWSDPELGISWPMEPTILSERAAAFGSVASLRERLFGGINA